MTAPTPADGPSQNDRPRYRPGQIVTYRVTDTTSGDQLSGHALVLKVAGETADLVMLGIGHLQTHVDNLAPAKVDEVHNPLPAPQPAAEGSTGP